MFGGTASDGLASEATQARAPPLIPAEANCRRAAILSHQPVYLMGCLIAVANRRRLGPDRDAGRTRLHGRGTVHATAIAMER